MRLLERYILSELVRVFTFVLSAMTVLLVFVGVFREVSEQGLGPLHALQILPYVVPSLLPFTIPATLLLTVCVVYGRISGDQEITAAKAAGINVLSLLSPAFILGGVLSVCSLVMSDQVIPWAVGNIQRVGASALEDIFLDKLRSESQIADPDQGYSITVIGVEGKRLILPTFQYAKPGHDPITIQAQEAAIEFDMDEQCVVLDLVHARIDVRGEQKPFFDRKTYRFPLPREITDPKPRHLSIRNIRKLVEKKGENLADVRSRLEIETAFSLATGNFDRLLDWEMVRFNRQAEFDHEDLATCDAEVHGRFALSASCLFFVLVGGPFAISQAKRQFLTSFFVCFVPILIIYYPVTLLMMTLSKMGWVDPAWAMWMGNLLLAIVSGFLLRKVLQH